MNWTVKVSSKAEKYFSKLDKKTRTRVIKTLAELSGHDNPLDHGDAKPLTGELKGFFRLRVGDYRIVFSILEKEHIIAVVNIAPRGNVY